MYSDPFDFALFQSRVLLTQRPGIPLQENLRELMAAVLGKVIEFSGASSAVHIFPNPSLGEAHIMDLRTASNAWQAVEDLALYRDGASGQFDRSKLPAYHRVDIPKSSSFFSSLNDFAEPHQLESQEELLHVLQRLRGDAQLLSAPPETQGVIVIPLARERYRRLGAVVLFGCAENQSTPLNKGRSGEAFVEFGRGVSRLLVRVFTNYYRMQPHTYLPSYFCTKRKKVALLVAEVRHFDWISHLLISRDDMNPDQRRACLCELLNCFSETVADVVERYRGRIDHMWGAGLLAVFGEYLDTERDAAVDSCMRAIQAAAQAVELFDRAKNSWIISSFRIDEFRKQHTEHLATGLAAAISYGGVEFDYVGSRDHRSYMAFGDHVSLVKDLVSCASRTVLDSVSSRRLEAPILVTQPAFLQARQSCIRDAPGQQTGAVDANAHLQLPTTGVGIPAYSLWPSNVSATAI